MVKKLTKITKDFIIYINDFLFEKTQESRGQIIPFSIIFFINYPLYYFIWLYISPQGYENLPLRVSASLICMPLIFCKYWPMNLKKYLPVYWYFAVIYCIPFFFVFMTLNNDASTVWMLNLLLTLFLLFLIFDLASMLLIVSTGTLLGVLIFSISSGSFAFNPGTIDLNGALATFFAAFIIGGIFNRYREKMEKERLETIRSMGAAIAHEVRTPLRSIDAGIQGVQHYLPDLVQSYEIAKKADLPVPYIPPSDYKVLGTSLQETEQETRAVFNIIEMLLVKADLSQINKESFREYSLQQCLQKVVERYHFDLDERELVHIDTSKDFNFYGNQDLVAHVFFNLLQNALYFIKAASKGDIHIWIEQSEECNEVHFKDTGAGIPKRSLPHIFDKFYTTTKHGTGVGLAFCKLVMQSMDGSIKCYSNEGSFTEFVLKFPNKRYNK
jgi:signal transduction histidine kinase